MHVFDLRYNSNAAALFGKDAHKKIAPLKIAGPYFN